jgi:acyl-CoA thioester hydrolase
MARADFRFLHRLRVRYGETDMQGVVFNANHLLYYDVAVTEYLRAAGWDYRAHMGTGVDFHVVRALAEYAAPIRFDDLIDVGVRPGRLGTTSVTWALEVHPADADRVLATGEIVWVNTDQATHRPTPLPADFRAAVEALEARPPAAPG